MCRCLELYVHLHFDVIHFNLGPNSTSQTTNFYSIFARQPLTQHVKIITPPFVPTVHNVDIKLYVPWALCTSSSWCPWCPPTGQKLQISTLFLTQHVKIIIPLCSHCAQYRHKVVGTESFVYISKLMSLMSSNWSRRQTMVSCLWWTSFSNSFMAISISAFILFCIGQKW